jgi:hypothetical protein
MVVGGAPPFALVIEQAAGVEAEVAADRSHVAMGRPGDAGRSLRQHWIVPHHLRMRGELGERDRGADLDRLGIGRDGAQLGDVVDVDQHRRRDDAAPDIDHEISAAADEAAVGVLGECLDDVVQRARADQREGR